MRRLVALGESVAGARTLACFLVTILVSHLGAAPARAEDETTNAEILVAELEGMPIPATSAGDYFCHDFDYPVIHCFRTEAALEAAVSTSLSSAVAESSDGTLTIAAVSYVRVWEYASYAGNNAYLSQDYSNLADIGWNDRISSYWALNSETGAFYTDGAYGGYIDYFCCNQKVASLDSTFDNRISSVRRT